MRGWPMPATVARRAPPDPGPRHVVVDPATVARTSLEERETMAEHENVARLRQGYEAFAAADMEKMNEFIPENAVWHVTGNNVFSGDYKGRGEVYGYFGKLLETSGGTFKASLLHALGDDSFSVAIQRTTATFNGQDISSTDILVNRIKNGESVETWIYLENEKLFEGIQI
jgi:uncharacterized protein